MSTSAVAVGTTAAGALLIWSGVKGASVLTSVQELVQGTKPTGQQMYPIGTPVGSSSSSGAGTGVTGDASGMVGLAMAQVGVREGAGNSQKYSHEIGRPSEAWCADFIVWLAKKTGNSSVIPHTASAPGMAQAFGSRYRNGRNGIEPGDIVFQHGASNGWNGIGHVGICVSSTKMVAGNYGDVVASYSWNTSKTVGYAKPGYKSGADVTTGMANA
jgi:hypothetical protein